jgi:NAD(P)-dependent dehydrogenase (short-subunit alcohol dehydrogenase family)
VSRGRPLVDSCAILRGASHVAACSLLVPRTAAICSRLASKRSVSSLRPALEARGRHRDGDRDHASQRIEEGPAAMARRPSSEADSDAIVNAALAAHGGIDILVVAAGMNDVSPITDMNPERFAP